MLDHNQWYFNVTQSNYLKINENLDKFDRNLFKIYDMLT